jgi:hypothetical protein
LSSHSNELFRDELTLVVTAFALLARMKRHGNERGASRKRQHVGRPAKNLRDIHQHVKSAVILKFVDQGTRGTFEQNRGPAFPEGRREAFAVRTHAFAFHDAVKRMTAGRTMRR